MADTQTVPLSTAQRTTLAALKAAADSALGKYQAYLAAIVDGADAPAGATISDLTDAGIILALPESA